MSSAVPPPPQPPRKDRIVVGAADLNTGSVDGIVRRMTDAQQVPLVRQVGEPQGAAATGGRGNALFVVIVVMAAAGAIAGLLMWALVQVSDDWFTTATSVNLFFSVSLAAIIGVVVAGADAALSRSWPKIGLTLAIAVPAALVCGLALGTAANQLYTKAQESILRSFLESVGPGATASDELLQQFFDYQRDHNHIWRGLAWALCGLAAGLTVGIASRSWRRTILTSVGGLVGGFVGGFVFDFLPGEDVAQLFGFIITGVLVAVAMVIVEQAVKSYWLEVASGGMSGKQFILYVDRATIGAAATASVTLVKDPGIQGIHAIVSRRSGHAEIEPASPMASVVVDGVQVGRAPLRDGALITLGNTVLRFRERGADAASVGSIRPQ